MLTCHSCIVRTIDFRQLFQFRLQKPLPEPACTSSSRHSLLNKGCRNITTILPESAELELGPALQMTLPHIGHAGLAGFVFWGAV